MAANVDFLHCNYHPGTYCSNQERMPAPHVPQSACYLAANTYMRGREHMPLYHPLPSSTNHGYAFEELPESHYDPFGYAEPIVAIAPVPGAFFPFSPPSPTPSPLYPERDVNSKVEIMEGIQSTTPHAIYGAPPPMPGANQRIPCQWQNCSIYLDDVSHSGIRRHFRDFHAQSRGSTVRCQWGGTCMSEQMLYDNIAKHIAECHLKSMRTACTSCGNTFARNDTLRRHLNAGCPALGRQG